MAKTKPEVLSQFELDAIKAGIDISLIDYNLSLSVEKRVLQHENALGLVEELQKAGQKLYEKPRAIARSPR